MVVLSTGTTHFSPQVFTENKFREWRMAMPTLLMWSSPFDEMFSSGSSARAGVGNSAKPVPGSMGAKEKTLRLGGLDPALRGAWEVRLKDGTTCRVTTVLEKLGIDESGAGGEGNES